MDINLTELKEFNKKAYLGKQMPRVIACAILSYDNKVYSLGGTGADHQSIRDHMSWADGIHTAIDFPHGFLLATGEFVNRRIGMIAASRNNQLNKEALARNGRDLYSYDIEHWDEPQEEETRQITDNFYKGEDGLVVSDFKEADVFAYREDDFPRIVGVAIRQENKVYHMKGPCDHQRLRRHIKDEHGITFHPDHPHGFMLADGCYANRREARDVALFTDQLDEHAGHELYSNEVKW